MTEGTLRVWAMRNFREPTHYYVDTPEEGGKLINQLADADLKNPDITDNAFGLEVYEDGEWCEWWDDEGREIGEYMEELKESKEN